LDNLTFDSIRHDQAMYARITPEFEFQGDTPQKFQAWAEAFRPRLRQALGLEAIAAQTAGHQPTAVRGKVIELADHIRESWHLWVEPSVPLPFYLLRPKGTVGARPLVLTPHGHNHPYIYVGIAHDEAERKSIQEGERDIAVQAVREGYLVIAPTARGFGETRTQQEIEEGKVSSCHTQLMHDLLVGRTPVGERVWDISCLIEWALGNLDMDAGRIAVTGNSGGGTVALFAAACEPRISAAMPGSYFCTFRGSIGTIRHCDCNYIPGLLGLGEMYDIAGLIAPRPFLAIAGVQDPIFPIDHVRTAFRRLHRIYTAAGVPERCALSEGQGGHRFYKADVWPFLRRWWGDSKNINS
jgi:dienelactone hydrolase